MMLWMLTEMWREVLASNETLPIKARPENLPNIPVPKLPPCQPEWRGKKFTLRRKEK